MDTLEKLTQVFRDTFDDEELVIHPGTTAKDVPAWDSVMHVTLMINVEGAFKLRFKSGEVAGLKNVGELVALINSRRK
jgi:acyl carrier protein